MQQFIQVFYGYIQKIFSILSDVVILDFSLLGYITSLIIIWFFIKFVIRIFKSQVMAEVSEPFNSARSQRRTVRNSTIKHKANIKNQINKSNQK